MPWGPIVFGAVVALFALLVVLAVVRMRRKKVAEEMEDGSEPEQLEPGEPEGDEAGETEEPGGEEAPDRPEPEPVLPEGARTIPDSPHAKGRQPRPGHGKHAGPDHAAERERLSTGLAKTRGGFIARLSALFKGKAELDAALVDQIEEILFTADIGVSTSHELIEDLRKELSKQQLRRPEAVWRQIRQRSAALLATAAGPPIDVDRARPFVILVVGVNGTGKTTTIGKLAARLHDEGRRVVLAAGDTFRAAAAEQLQIWGERTSSEVVKGKEGADPSSVIIDALKKAQQVEADVVIADTAGRLHTKVNLMEEIQKVRRSIAKRIEGAPHETFLVLDATTGQNAIAQAKIFKEAVSITGLILTKLDGTAKGGVVLGICNELRIPIRFIGIGERAEDLREFDSEAFVEALYQGAESPEPAA